MQSTLPPTQESSVLAAERVFNEITDQQIKEYAGFRNGGFDSITRNMGAFRASMEEKNVQKRQKFLFILSALRNLNEKTRLEAWEAIERILKRLDLARLREIDDEKVGSLYMLTLADLSVFFGESYGKIKGRLLAAKRVEKNKGVTEQAAKVIAIFSEVDQRFPQKKNGQ